MRAPARKSERDGKNERTPVELKGFGCVARETRAKTGCGANSMLQTSGAAMRRSYKEIRWLIGRIESERPLRAHFHQYN